MAHAYSPIVEGMALHWMVGASCANWRLCLTCLSLLLVVPITWSSTNHSLLAGRTWWTGRRNNGPLTVTICTYQLQGSDPIAALLGPEGGTLRCPNDTLRRHRDYSDIHHWGTDGLIRGELSTLTRTLAVSHCEPMDMKLQGFKQRVLGTFVTHAFRGVVTGTWTSAPAFTYAGHYPMSNYRPTYSSLGFPDSGTLAGYQLHQMHLMTSDVIQPYPWKGPGL